ncbi:MAG: hypothetical protein LBF85_09225 [Tannerella sp.]|nr:hypothetical protein [Tannerella sp.]
MTDRPAATLQAAAASLRRRSLKQSSTGREPGLLRLTATGDMFHYLLIISPLDCFAPRNDAGTPLPATMASPS